MTRFGAAVNRLDERIPGVDLPLLSVSQTRGVIRRTELTDKPPRAETLDVYKVCRAGDIVFNKMSIRAGALGVAAEAGLVTYHYEVMRPRRGFDARYLVYLLKSQWFIGQMVLRERGIGAGDQVGVRTTEVPFKVLRTIESYLPGESVQRAVADYLDRETARIDALITKQTALIAMLRLRRQAAIDEAVPASTNAVQLRRVIRFLTSGSRGWSDFYADHGERFVRIANLSRGSLDVGGEIQLVDLPPEATEGSRTRTSAGDVVFSITAYLGSVGVIRHNWVDAYVSQHVALCRIDATRLSSDFLGWFMLSTRGQDQLKQGAVGGTKQQLGLDDIRGLQVPLPPLDVQEEVVRRIEGQLVRIDTLIAKAEEFIELAKERRAALITAAVTGQIDVREGAA